MRKMFWKMSAILFVNILECRKDVLGKKALDKKKIVST